MSYPTAPQFYGRHLPLAQAEVSSIARAISRFEPVELYAPASEMSQAGRLAAGANIVVKEAAAGHPWARDFGPIFVREHRADGTTRLCGVDFNFNGWGGRDPGAGCAGFARHVLDAAGIARTRARITAEGGALEISPDGRAALATESSLVGPSRNLGARRDWIEAELARLLGVETVLWVPGVADKDATDAHVDALARFVRADAVVLSRPPPDSTRGEAWTRVYGQFRDMLGKARFKTIDLQEPASLDGDRLGELGGPYRPVTSYVNYYHVNGGLIVPSFASPATDEAALRTLEALHADKRVVQVPIAVLPRMGGGIHCVTQQVPAVGAGA